MNESDKNEVSKSPQDKDNDLLDLDKGLADLISVNESLKIGISKILKEIDKKDRIT